MQNVDTMRRLTGVVKAAPEGESGYDVEVVCSTAAVDRESEIIDQAGWDLGNFRKNPVFLAAHQHRLADGRSSVIGSFTSIDVAKGSGLVGRVRFADTELGREYRTLYRDGHMRAVSVGFLSRKGETRLLEAPGRPVPEQQGRRVYVHTECELYEVSAVAVGCNQEALARLRELGLDGSARDRAADLEKLIRELIGGLREDLLAELDDVKAMIPDTVNPRPGTHSEAAGAREDGAERGAGESPSDAKAVRKTSAELTAAADLWR
ncbi:MAG: HK97 family phage prohead protease [Lentisphaeria bacterium]